MQILDLRKRREAAGWTVTELAQRSATSDLVINRLEMGVNYEDQIAQQVLNALPAPKTPTPPVPTPSVHGKDIQGPKDPTT